MNYLLFVSCILLLPCPKDVVVSGVVIVLWFVPGSKEVLCLALIEIDINNIEHSLSIIEKAIENTQIINMSNIIEARRSILLDFNMLSLIATAINRFEKI